MYSEGVQTWGRDGDGYAKELRSVPVCSKLDFMAQNQPNHGQQLCNREKLSETSGAGKRKVIGSNFQALK